MSGVVRDSYLVKRRRLSSERFTNDASRFTLCWEGAGKP